MAKRSRRAISKKGLVGLQRIVNNQGKRVWLYKGLEYPTLRSIIENIRGNK